MTVLSRAFIRRMIIQEMRKPPLSSGLTFDDDDATINIDDETEIDDIPSFMEDDDDTEYLPRDLNSDMQDMYLDDEFDDFGFDDDYADEDFEFESETEEDSESETEYNPGRQVMDMSAEEIRRHVTAMADRLASPAHGQDKRTRAEMKYDELVKQGREAEMPDPEFMGSEELDDLDRTSVLPPSGGS